MQNDVWEEDALGSCFLCMEFWIQKMKISEDQNSVKALNGSEQCSAQETIENPSELKRQKNHEKIARE